MAAALAGKNYFTLPEMMDIISKALKNHNIFWGHLDKQWDFTTIRTEIGVEFQRLRNAHSLCFTRTANGITVRWRQWLTDSEWSRPILLLNALRMQQVCHAVRPPEIQLAFPEATANGIKSFLDKLEILLESSDALGSTVQGQAGSTVRLSKDRRTDVAWLRRVAQSEEITLKRDDNIEDIISDLVRRGQGSVPATGSTVKETCLGLEDTVVQLYPGSDVCAPEVCAWQWPKHAPLHAPC